MSKKSKLILKRNNGERSENAALVECFEEHFGLNKFDDCCVDELDRHIET